MTKNPADEFAGAHAAHQSARKQREIEHLDRWRQSKDPEHLEPLLKAYTPVMERALKSMKAPSLNEEAARAQMKKVVIKAFETYDPARGTALNTHVTNQLPKFLRYNSGLQNFAYMPEEQTRQIGHIQRAKDRLTEDLGREPSHAEIGQALPRPLTAKRVEQILTAQRKDIAASSFEDDPASHELSRDHEILSLLHYSLDEDERQVFNHLYGREGAPKIESTSALAQRLGKSPSQVSRLKTRILTKYEGYRRQR